MTVLTWPTAAFDSVAYERAARRICQSSFWGERRADKRGHEGKDLTSC
jgi:hypothetical protein